MKLPVFFFCLLYMVRLNAQELPFIHRDQIDRWKNSTADTVYVINFWATWCGPCVAELPVFEKLNARYAGRNVQVVLVSNDFKRQVDSKLKPFIQKKRLKSKVVFMDESNPNVWVNNVNPEWSGAIPATWIFSGKSKKALFFEKPLKYKELEQAVLSVMGK